MDRFGMPITSAAVPAFQQRPRESEHPVRIYGYSCGRITQPHRPRNLKNVCHLQKRCVQFPQAVPRVCIQDRKYHQKRNHNRKILRRNPDQDQNHKRSDRHCFHCCNQRRQEFFCNGKPTGKCSSCNSRCRTKKESGSDACSGKQQGLPEDRFCYKRKKAFQNSGRRCQKDLLPDKNAYRLPDHKPEHDRPELRFSLFLFFVFIRNNRSHLLEVLLRLPPGSGL